MRRDRPASTVHALRKRAVGQKTEPPKLSLDLLGNGIDFIRKGVEGFFEENDPKSQGHKYAVLHIFSGVILILKEKLRREHPSLIFTKVHSTGPEASTVGVEELLLRLETCAGMKLSKGQHRTLDAARRIRNRIEHYRFELKRAETERIIGRLVEFAFQFLRDQLGGVELEQHLEQRVWHHVQELVQIAERLGREELEEWRGRANSYSDLDDAALAKLFESGEGDPREGTPDQYLDCPQCDMITVVPVEADVGVCTNVDCRDVVSLGSCERCGQITSDELLVCGDCSSYIQYQMDQD